ncbi:MAG: alpha/beta hydrolase [Candidatus Andersenbacteria bacterium]
MAKRAFIVHGWDGYPEEGWFPWMKRELEQRDFVVAVLSMPDPAVPTIDAWVGHLAQIVGEPDEQTYFLGHSIGCQAILRYVASISGRKIGGIVLVAGFLELKKLETDEEETIARPWLTTPIDFKQVQQATRNITVILSDNDAWVPLARNTALFKQHLNPRIIVEHEKGHYSGSDGITELPAARDAVVQDN